MAGIKISALPLVVSAQLTDLFPVVQGGVTSGETLSQVQTLFGFSGGILPLSKGGTNANLTASNGGIFYSTATAGAILSGTATAGKVLQSGAMAAPTWSTPTYPSASGTAGQVLASDGTNIIYTTPTFPTTVGASGSIITSNGTNWIASTSLWPNTVGTALHILLSNGTSNVYSTPAYPNASVTAGKVIISDGTNYIASTSIFPNTVGAAGTILRSDGTVNAYSTATFADTYTASNLLYSNGANTVTGLATANSSVLITSGAGVPSLSTTLPSGISATNMILTTPEIITSIKDSNGNVILGIGPTASAVNYINLSNQAAGQPPNFSAMGSDTNITLVLHGKGNGGVNMDGSFNGSSPGQGYVGYSVSSQVTSGSPVSLTNNTAANVTHINLAAGNYVAYGNVSYVGNTGTSSAALAWLSSTSAAVPDASLYTQTTSIGAANNDGIGLAPKYFSSASSFTIYLSTLALFTVALNVCGLLTIVQLS